MYSSIGSYASDNNWFDTPDRIRLGTPDANNGNPYSYFNSSRQEGKTPSPDAPRVEEVSASDEYYCDVEKEYVPIQVIVYDKINADGEYEGFREQATYSPYFDSSNKNMVNVVYVKTGQEFIDAWNSIAHAEKLFVYVHSGHGERSGDGALIFENEAISFNDDFNINGGSAQYKNYSYDNLNEINVDQIYLFSCHGADYGVDNNIAVEFAERTGADVLANTGGVSFTKIQDEYHARSGGNIFDLGIWEIVSVDDNGIASWTMQWPLSFIGGKIN